MKRHRTSAWILGTALTAISALAAAEEPRHVNAVQLDTYGYTFTDDPLQAGLFGPNDTQCFVRTHGMRATLIRPRTAFVVELLKSVEKL